MVQGNPQILQPMLAELQRQVRPLRAARHTPFDLVLYPPVRARLTKVSNHLIIRPNLNTLQGQVESFQGQTGSK